MDENKLIGKLDQKTRAYTTPQQHCLDVAHLTHELFGRQADHIQQRMADWLGVSVDSCAAWLGVLGGAHDCLKLSWAFQYLRGIDEKYQELNGSLDGLLQQMIQTYKADYGSKVSPLQHAVLADVALPDLLVQVTGVPEHLAQQLTHPVSGHHGLYPTDDIADYALDYLESADFQEQDFHDLRVELLTELWSRFGGEAIELPKQVPLGFVFWASSLIIQADHIGSRAEQMPLTNGKPRTERETRQRAALVLDRYGVCKPLVSGRLSYKQLGFAPRPMQKELADLDMSVPGFTVVKTATGGGKTLASLQLAHTGEGYSFLANTRSTATGVWRQLNSIYDGAGIKLPQPIALAHSGGCGAIERHIEEMVQDQNPEDLKLLQDSYALQREGIADALTSDICVATIDQALMSVFSDGRWPQRNFWLFHKPIIIDELHSFDGRMDSLIERLLEVAGIFGTPVIGLTATISSQKLHSMMAAYARGAGVDYKPQTLSSRDQILYIRSDGTEETIELPSCASTEKEVGVEFFENADWDKVVLSQTKRAERICVLGATTRCVQDLYSRLKPELERRGYQCLCYHSRLTPVDRLAKEASLFRLVGKGSSGTKVVVFATSVIRESLDVDFDVLVTHMQLMPDLIQAIGRVWRHDRPSRQCDAPRVYIERPAYDQAKKRLTFHRYDLIVTDKMSGSLKGYRAYYALRTYLLLSQLSLLRLPLSAQALVDQVFVDLEQASAEVPLPSMPIDWSDAWKAFLRKQKRVPQAEQESTKNQIIPAGFTADQADYTHGWLSDFTIDKLDRRRHQTREIGASIQIYVKPEKPLYSGGFIQHVQQHTVSIANSQYLLDGLQEHVPEKWGNNRILNHVALLPYGEQLVFRSNGQLFMVTYSSDIGLRID